ncbi:type II toxin-antitoxin system RelE/ParE family toxin [Candidatus Desantisbacteria bacterium]|nr:type II toxin-antitoxin system RelE/ParE family toxin [Candidatus Desantisbacteria bacterium]
MDKIEKLIWTEDGIKSFEDVIQYISYDSPYYASDFAKKILLSIEKLNTFPQIGRLVPEYSNPDIRELIYQNYRIVYKINKNVIYLVLVIHGSHELPKII